MHWALPPPCLRPAGKFRHPDQTIHIGKCAEDGYRAARLAQAGFTSSTVALEGKEGFLYEYADLREEGDEFHRIMASMGHDWDICAPGFTLKRWPSCSSTHRPVTPSWS